MPFSKLRFQSCKLTAWVSASDVSSDPATATAALTNHYRQQIDFELLSWTSNAMSFRRILDSVETKSERFPSCFNSSVNPVPPPTKSKATVDTPSEATDQPGINPEKEQHFFQQQLKALTIYDQHWLFPFGFGFLRIDLVPQELSPLPQIAIFGPKFLPQKRKGLVLHFHQNPEASW